MIYDERFRTWLVMLDADGGDGGAGGEGAAAGTDDGGEGFDIGDALAGQSDEPGIDFSDDPEPGNDPEPGAEEGNEDPEPGKVKSKYVTQLSKKYQDDDFSGVETLDDLYQSRLDLLKERDELAEKQKGALFMPNKDSSAEEIKDFFMKLGMPETKDGYKLDNYKHEGEAIETMKQRLISQAFRYGLTPGQARGIWKHELATIDEIDASMNKAREEAEKNYEPEYDSLLREEYPDDSKRAERRTEETNLYKELAASNGDLAEIVQKYGLDKDAKAIHALVKLYEKGAQKHIAGREEPSEPTLWYPGMAKKRAEAHNR